MDLSLRLKGRSGPP